MVSLRRAAMSMVAVLALVATALLVAGPAQANPAYPPRQQCALSSSTGSGNTLTITGSGYPANTTVQVNVGSTSLGSVRTDSSGAFRLTVTVPSGSTGRVSATGGNRTCSFPLSGNNGGSGTQGTQTTPHAAYTGFAAITATVIALVLLGGGLVLVLAGRRRRQN